MNHKTIHKILGNSKRTSGFAVVRAMIPGISRVFPTSGLRRVIYGHPHMFTVLLTARHFQLLVYTVWRGKSKFAVRNNQILQTDHKM